MESSLKTLSEQLAGACQNVAVQAASAAAVTGAESAKATIAQQIEAVQENGTVWLPVPQHSVREHSLWQTQFQH